MLKKFPFFLFLLSAPLFAADLHPACGSYEMSGFIRKGAKHYSIAIAEGTNSEKHFILPFIEELKTLPYVNLPVKVIVNLSKRNGEIASVDTIAQRVPDPLHPGKDSYFKQLKAAPCK